MPNGTDLLYSDFQSQKKNSRFILSVGRLEKSKGLQYLIKSFYMLCREKEFDDVSLIIVGGKGPYKSRLVKMANELNIMNRIRMLENISQERLKKIYHDCDIFVLLSKYESHSIALLDALAMHKPVISTRRGGLEEYVRKGYCIGVEWPPDPEKVAEKMKQALENPDECKPGRIEVLSWDKVTERLISLYNNVLTEK
jgi:glycosyltransferase involved in cell wall biosynthesis